MFGAANGVAVEAAIEPFPEDDETAVAALRLELAEAHEAARDAPRAIEVLRRAASVRPRDVAPWQRLTDLLLRIGDWSGALATLRSWDAVLADPIAKAGITVRIGRLLRDHGKDRVAAEAAAAGSPPLVARHSGLAEVAAGLEESYPEHLRHLASFETGDPTDLARKLNEILGLASADHDELRAAGRRAVVERWSWASVAERLLA